MSGEKPLETFWQSQDPPLTDFCAGAVRREQEAGGERVERVGARWLWDQFWGKQAGSHGLDERVGKSGSSSCLWAESLAKVWEERGLCWPHLDSR